MVVQIFGGICGSLLVAGLVPGSYIGEAQLSRTSHMSCKVPLPQSAACAKHSLLWSWHRALNALLLDLESHSLRML